MTAPLPVELVSGQGRTAERTLSCDIAGPNMQATPATMKPKTRTGRAEPGRETGPEALFMQQSYDFRTPVSVQSSATVRPGP